MGLNLEILMAILLVEDAGFLACSFSNHLTLSQRNLECLMALCHLVKLSKNIESKHVVNFSAEGPFGFIK